MSEPTRPKILAPTRSGRFVDLLSPDFSRLDMHDDVALPLARIARWGGATTGDRPWSVGQHSVVGAEALLAETGDATLALAFLIHDVHEIFVGEITRSSRAALAHYVAVGLRLTLGPVAAAAAETEAGGDLFAVALDGLCGSLDRAVRARAGLPPTLPRAVLAAVAEMDERMAATEARDLLIDGPTIAAEPIRRRGPLRPWSDTETARRWTARFEQWRIKPKNTH